MFIAPCLLQTTLANRAVKMDNPVYLFESMV